MNWNYEFQEKPKTKKSREKKPPQKYAWKLCALFDGRKKVFAAIIKSKLNEIKGWKKKLKTHCTYCLLENKLVIKVLS